MDEIDYSKLTDEELNAIINPPEASASSATQDMDKMSVDELKEYANSVIVEGGGDPDSIIKGMQEEEANKQLAIAKKQEEWEKKRLENLQNSIQSSKLTNMKIATEVGVADALLGTGAWFTNMLISAKNANTDLINEALKLTNKAGITNYQLLPQEPRAYQKEMAEAGDVAKVVNTTLTVAAPAVAAMATGGASVAGSMASDAVWSYLLQDPNGGRFSDMFEGTIVEDIPIVGQIIDGMQTKPDDTTWQGRLKNIYEQWGLGAMVGLVVKGGIAGKRAVNARKALDEPPKPPPQSAPIPKDATPAPIDTTVPVSGVEGTHYTIIKDVDGTPMKDVDGKIIARQHTPDEIRAIQEHHANVEADAQILNLDQPPVSKTTTREIQPIAWDDKFLAHEPVHLSKADMDGVTIPTANMVDDGGAMVPTWITPDTGEVMVKVHRGRSGTAMVNISELKAAPRHLEGLAVRPDENIINKIIQSMPDNPNLLDPADWKESAKALERVKTNPEELATALQTQKITYENKHLAEQYIAALDMELSKTTEALLADPDNLALRAKFASIIKANTKLSEGIQALPRGGAPAVIMNKPIIGTAAEALQVSEKEAVRAVGAEGRDALLNQMVKAGGGDIDAMANTAQFAKNVAYIQGLPDEAFIRTMSGVRLKGRYETYSDAFIRMASAAKLTISGAARIIFQNGLVAGAENMSKYASVPFAAMRGQGKQQFMNAWNYSKGSLYGVSEAIGSVRDWDNFIKGTPKYKSGKSFDSIFDHGVVTPPKPNDMVEGVFNKFLNSIDQRFVYPTINKLAKASDIVPRVYGIADAPFKNSAYQAHMWEYAEKFYADMPPSPAKADAIKKFTNGALDHGPAHKAAREAWFEADKAATEMVGYMTSSGDVKGRIGKAVLEANNAVKRVPVVREVVGVAFPFLRATVHSLGQALEYSGVGSVVSPRFYANMLKGGEARDMALGRLAVGTTALWGVSQMIDHGIIGVNTDYKNKNRLRTSQGAGALWINTPNGKVDIGRTGIGSVIVSMAHKIHQVKDLNPDQNIIRSSLAGGAASILEVFTEQQFTQSVSDIISVADGQMDWQEYTAKQAATAIPLINIADQITDMVDTTARSPYGDEFADKFMNRLKSKIPGLSTQVDPILNYWGEEVKKPIGMPVYYMDLLAGEDKETTRLQDTITRYQRDAELLMHGSDIVGLDIKFRDVPNNLDNEFFKVDTASNAKVQFKLDSQDKYDLAKIIAGLNPADNTPMYPHGRTLKQDVAHIIDQYNGWNKELPDIPHYVDMITDINYIINEYYVRGLEAYGKHPETMRRKKLDAEKYNSAYGVPTE